MHDPACKKCGDCCRTDTTDIRIYQNLTAKQARAIRVPRTKDKCCQLTKKGLCGIEKKFGHEAKCDICKQAKCMKGKNDGKEKESNSNYTKAKI